MSFTRGDGVILVPYSRAIGTLTSTKNFSSVAVLLEDSSYYEVAGQAVLKSLNASRQLAYDSEIISVSVNTEVIILAAFVSFAVGIVFGLYPARNAARLQPVDALRSE